MIKHTQLKRLQRILNVSTCVPCVQELTPPPPTTVRSQSQTVLLECLSYFNVMIYVTEEENNKGKDFHSDPFQML